MHIFIRKDRINFVDDNEVFVGYEYKSQCCENFGYFFADSPKVSEYRVKKLKENQSEFDLAEYVFDTSYCVKNSKKENRVITNYVQFKLIKLNCENLYLTLFNVHNGYYYHGFDWIENGKIIKEGEL